MKHKAFAIIWAIAAVAILMAGNAQATDNMAPILAQTPVFEGVSDSDLAKLTKVSKLERVPAEYQLIKLDGKLNKLYVITAGEADIRVAGGQVVATVGPGVILGEMEFVDEQPAAADVIMNQDGEVLVMPMSDLRKLLDADPALGYLVMENIARKISMNLRDMQ